MTAKTITAHDLDFNRCTLGTAKGRHTGTLREVCKKQASIQGALATISVPCGDLEVVQVNVDDIDFDADDLEAAVETVRCAIELEAEDMGIIAR